jgi:hypothetical protein
MDIAKVYFTIGYYPRLRRAIIIYIPYKEGRPAKTTARERKGPK